MNATEIVAKEQVLFSLMKSANAEMADALSRKEDMTKASDIAEMNEDIVNFRTNVIKKIQAEISTLETEKKTLAGITDFNWRH